VCVAPHQRWPLVTDAVERGGGEIVEPHDADAIVWTDPADADGLRGLLDDAPGIRWVQLPIAGIERFVDLVDDTRLWSCAKGVYAEPVAEMALSLSLAGLRSLPAFARRRTWGAPAGTTLFDQRVAVLGGGGIGRAFVGLLAPWRCHVTVVRRTPVPVDGAASVVGMDDLDVALRDATLVVLALPLTPATHGIIDARALRQMHPGALIVNVARGEHIVTDDLVSALATGAIAGACLDVTDPEPLPPDHPLWSEPNCLVTPHTSAPVDVAIPLLARWIEENVRRVVRGHDPNGLIDHAAGY
jgi:phosphoglycerate dehydrogenase-like enzyme